MAKVTMPSLPARTTSSEVCHAIKQSGIGVDVAHRMVASPGRRDDQSVDIPISIEISSGQKHVLVSSGLCLRAIGFMAGKELRHTAIGLPRQRHQRAADSTQQCTSISCGDARLGCQAKHHHVTPTVVHRLHQTKAEIKPVAECQRPGALGGKYDFRM